MRYGICTWILDQDLEPTARFLADAGFDGVELKGDLTRSTAGEAKAILDAHKLRVLSLTPENVDLAHPDPAVRAEAMDYYCRLLEYAAALGAPLISCHGAVGRVRAISSFAEEYGHLVAGVRELARRAAPLGLQVAMEVLNRYESHLLNTSVQARDFVRTVGEPNVGILLDAYHANIEEANLPLAILEAGANLALFHAADSNRQAVGRGHTDWTGIMRALRRIGYAGDIIFECTAPGPDPFTPIKGQGWRDQVRQYAVESLEAFRLLSHQA